MDIDRLIATLLNGGCLPERDLKLICDRAKEIFLEESNIQPVRAPVNVCGDIHGQFYDLQALMKEGGDIPSSNYIFIGDFVDINIAHQNLYIQYIIYINLYDRGLYIQLLHQKQVSTNFIMKNHNRLVRVLF